MLRIKAYITKKLLIRLVVFAALIATAFVLDAYSEKNLTEFKSVETATDNHHPESGEFYVLAQLSPYTVKTSVQKPSIRNLNVEKHTRFLRNYHSERNYQVLKAEVIQQTTPLISSYHFLVFQTHLFSPCEDPLG